MKKIVKPPHDNSSWSLIACMIWVGIIAFYGDNIPTWISVAVTILFIIWIGRDMFQLYKWFKNKL